MIRFELGQTNGLIWAKFPDEPVPRANLLFQWIQSMSAEGTPEMYLDPLDRIEAGESEIKVETFALTSHFSLKRVILEQACFSNPADECNPARTELSFAEARDLILRWRDAKAEWRKTHPYTSL